MINLKDLTKEELELLLEEVTYELQERQDDEITACVDYEDLSPEEQAEFDKEWAKRYPSVFAPGELERIIAESEPEATPDPTVLGIYSNQTTTLEGTIKGEEKGTFNNSFIDFNNYIN